MSSTRLSVHRPRNVLKRHQYICKDCRRSYKTSSVLNRSQPKASKSSGTNKYAEIVAAGGFAAHKWQTWQSKLESAPKFSRDLLKGLSKQEFRGLRKDALLDKGSTPQIFGSQQIEDKGPGFRRIKLPGSPQDAIKVSHPMRKAVLEDLRKWQADLEAAEQENKARMFQDVLDSNTNLLQRHLSLKYNAHIDRNKSQEHSDTTKLLEDFSVEPEARQPASLTPPAPGDLIEQSDGKTVHTGIIVRMFTDECLVYRQDGYLSNVAMRRVDRSYRIPGFESEAVLAPILPFLPSVDRQQASGYMELDNYVPAELGRALRIRLDRFLKEVEVLGHRHRITFEGIHQRMSSANIPKEFTLKELMDKLKIKLEDRTDAFKLALHRFLDLATHQFAALMPKGSGNYWAYTRSEVALRERVVGWIREYQLHQVYMSLREPGSRDAPKTMSLGAAKIQNFIIKARNTLQAYREQSATSTKSKKQQEAAPSNLTTMLPKLAIKDLEGVLVGKGEHVDPSVDIIRLLYYYGVKEMFDDDHALNSCARTMLAEMDSYDELDLNRNVLKEFLGHIRLYEYHRNLHPLRFTYQHNSRALAREFQVSSLPMPFKLGKDVLKHLRTDWTGPAPYCIDPAMDAARDDGISFEKNEDGTSWIHVHIANPAAFIPLDSPVAQYSKKIQETAFLPEATLEMTDRTSTLTQLSLHDSRPVLTHSMKLSEKGDIVDFKMGAHTIHETRLMTYAEFDAQLSGTTKPAKDQYKMTEVDITTMKHFKPLIQEWRRRHMGGPGPLASQQINRGASLEVAVPSTEGEEGGKENSAPESSNEVRIEAKPDERYESMDLVAACMQMTCVSVGKWAAARELPFIYRGTAQRPDMLTLNEYLDKVQNEPGFDQNALAERMVNDRIFRIFARAKSSSTPLRHNMLETASYARVTSPLRRFTDWLNQAQVQSALLWEARNGKSLADTAEDDRGPSDWLTQEEMEEQSQYSMLVTAAAGSVKLRTYHHWLAVKYMEDIMHKRLNPDVWRCKVELHVEQDKSTRQLLGVDREPKAYGVLKDQFRTPVYVCLTRKETSDDGTVVRRKVDVKGGTTRTCKIKKVWVRWGALEVELTD